MTAFDKIMNFNKSNRIVYDCLTDEIRNGVEVLPFVGAGISAFAYKTWRDFLLKFSMTLPKNDQNTIQDALDSYNYFFAAEFLCEKYGDLLFYKKVQDEFSENKINDKVLQKNAAFLIPRICAGNCITTNFDRVMEHACALNGFIPDRALPTNTRQLNQYLRGSNEKSSLIFKIHGDVLSNQSDIIFTESSYKKHYCENSMLRRQLTKWIDNKKLLFLGASLKNDKTVEIIKERMEEGMYNYAIYGCKESEISDLKNHFETLNIMAIFYDSSDHQNLTKFLKRLIKDVHTKGNDENARI